MALLSSGIGVTPGERFQRLSLEDCRETASPGDGPGGPMPARVSSPEDWSISTAPRLQRCRNDQGGAVLAVGIDWAEEFHLVALGSPSKGVTEVLRVEHTPTAVGALVA